jgi:DNA-binding LytR/AlgR family response regulator
MSATKILIVEDEVLIAEHIKDYLISFGMSQIYMAHNKNLALQAIENIKPDIVLLDMHLQHPLDGIEIANIIDDKGDPPYIFITANADMLIIQKAIHTKAAAYITKPLKKSDLFAAIQISLKSQAKPEEEILLLKESTTTIKILLSEILYIESNGNYINIHTKKQKVIARQSLEWAEEQLPGQQFMRIHRFYIVNMSAVDKSSSKSVFIGVVELPISRSNATKMADYLKKRIKK